MWRVSAGAVAATVAGVALLVAAHGTAETMSWATVQNVAVALTLVLVGAPVAHQEPGRRVGLLLLGAGLAMSLAIAGGGYAALGWFGAEQVGRVADDWLWAFAAIPLTTVLVAVFPDGHAPTPRWRPAIWLGWSATVAIAVQSATGVHGIVDTATSVLWSAAHLAGLAALTVRWRRARGVARQQVKYLVLAALLVFVIYSVADLLPYHVRQVGFLAVPLLLVAAVGLAVLRYRLYDIDVVIRRTAVLVGLTGLVFLVYLGVAAALGSDPSERAALAASVVVAALAEPARRRLQVATSRMLFGRRDEPLAALALLRDRLRVATDETQLACAVVEVVPSMIRARSVTLHLFRDGRIVEVARAGPLAMDGVAFPLVHQAELLGTLTVGLREPGVPFGRADTVLLTELSHQVAAAAHAVRLTAELRAAADRVFRAAAEERQRLRRDLHDRLGPLLLGTGLTVEALRRGTDENTSAGQGLTEVAAQLRSAAGEVRRIVDQLQPATLLELGLTNALRDHLERLSELPGGPSFQLVDRVAEPIPAPVQEAAYFLLLEAVTNVLRHADAATVSVRVERVGAELEIDVTDDGSGLEEPYVAGVGINSMRRRALEFNGTFSIEPGPGGGTRVHATFPLEEAPWTGTLPSGSSSPTTTRSSDSACAGSSRPFPASMSSVRPRTVHQPLRQPRN